MTVAAGPLLNVASSYPRPASMQWAAQHTITLAHGCRHAAAVYGNNLVLVCDHYQKNASTGFRLIPTPKNSQQSTQQITAAQVYSQKWWYKCKYSGTPAGDGAQRPEQHIRQ